jgi:uncharacterized DUF497 family protein
MDIEFDPRKDAENVASRGISFTSVKEGDWNDAILWSDDRFCYYEERINALVMIGDRLHFVSFTLRDTVMRVISVRKANNREIRRYGKEG